MAVTLRPCWRNCALETDAEIQNIDQMEDLLAPIGPDVSKVRELISALELCHHKAERWVHNIVEAIGAGNTTKGLGTRPAGQQHPFEETWQNACVSLSAWCAGKPSSQIDKDIGNVPASQLLAHLGERSPLKEWQVQRVIEKIRSSIHFPQSLEDPMAQYAWMLLGESEYDATYVDRCPEHYQEHEEFWTTTARTFIHDTANGNYTELSLSIAIDMLMPCHWSFVENLEIVLAAIGGTLQSNRPFAACGRNISLLPVRARMEAVCKALKAFYSDSQSTEEVDKGLSQLLGEPTDAKRWLAASLDKTIRLQMDPPDDLRTVCTLEGPGWLRL